MARLKWDSVGDRYYEAGVDRGVLYTDLSVGVPWIGLVSVTESPSGAEPRPYYMDGVKYLNLASSEEYEATIDAFSAPPEFAACDGVGAVQNGLFATQQPRKAFNMSYRTMIGNDTEGKKHAYKIHLVYNALAGTSDRNHTTMGSSVEPNTYTWPITTLPPSLTGRKPTSHFVIDSRYTPAGLLAAFEDILYGTPAEDARLPMPSELIELFGSRGPLKVVNYITNPAMRTLGGEVVIETNLVPNPNLRDLLGNGLPTNWGANTTNYTVVTDSTGVTFTSIGTGGGAGGPELNITLPATLVPGTVVTGAITFSNPNSALWRVHLLCYGAAGYLGSAATSSNFPADGTERVITGTVLPDTTSVRLALYQSGNMVEGEKVKVTFGRAIVGSGFVSKPFTGDTPGDDTYTYRWTGEKDNSTSQKVGISVASYNPSVSYGVSSSHWVSTSNVSMRHIATYPTVGSGYIDLATNLGGFLTLVRGMTYTVMAKVHTEEVRSRAPSIMFSATGLASATQTVTAPIDTGTYDLRLVFTVPTDPLATAWRVRLQTNVLRGEPDCWWDDVLITEGEYLGPYFDPSSSPTQGDEYVWDGAPDASVSRFYSWN